MQHIEYGYYDLASSELETKTYIQQAIKYKPQTISVLPYYIKNILPLINENTQLSTIVDYPFGLSTTQSRVHEVETCIKNGINSIEIIAPAMYLTNKKYDKFRQEISIIKDICIKSEITIKYIVDYRIFIPNLVYKICQILAENGIYDVYPSNCYGLDSISDNILASVAMHQKSPKSRIIATGQAWTDQHITMLLDNNKIYGYKTINLYTLEKIYYQIL